MKKINKKIIITLTSFVLIIFAGSSYVFAFGSPATVDLGTASNYIILSKTAISNTGATSITGDIGVSPIAATAMTGFSQTMDASNTYSTSTYVNGKLYASNYTAPTPSNMSTAISNMETAYNDATGRSADSTGLGGGNIGGMILAPGVYKWSTGVTIPTNVTLSGTASDVWIFEIAGNLSIASAKSVILTGGALPENIFWAVAGTTTLNTTSNFSGTILAGPNTSTIAMKNGAVLNGRALGQKDVTLINNTIVSSGGVVSIVDDITPVSNSSHSSSGSTPVYGCKDPTATNYNYFSSSRPSLCIYANVVQVVTPVPVIIVPKLPQTGFPPREKNTSWFSIMFSNIISLFR